MAKLKNHISSYAFDSREEEVRFFKEIKPRFYSRYIYFVNVYNYLMKQPPGGEEALRAYINVQLGDIKKFFDQNLSFYQYYRAGASQQDQEYFTRGGFNVHIELEDFEEDEQYSTSHDYKLSKIMANEKFQDFLNFEMSRIGADGVTALPGTTFFPFRHPAWTASQTDAVELIYALKAACAVNNGNIEISELVAIFEFIFQIELHDTYHKLLDISRRKRDMFVFLTRLKSSFENFINDRLSA